MVKQFMQTVADHEGNLMFWKIAVVEGADTFEDGWEFLLWGLAQTDADDFDELLPADEIAEVADIFDEFFSRIHVQSFQPSLEGLAVDAFLSHRLGGL